MAHGIYLVSVLCELQLSMGKGNGKKKSATASPHVVNSSQNARQRHYQNTDPLEQEPSESESDQSDVEMGPPISSVTPHPMPKPLTGTDILWDNIMTDVDMKSESDLIEETIMISNLAEQPLRNTTEIQIQICDEETERGQGPEPKKVTKRKGIDTEIIILILRDAGGGCLCILETKASISNSAHFLLLPSSRSLCLPLPFFPHILTQRLSDSIKGHYCPITREYTFLVVSTNKDTSPKHYGLSTAETPSGHCKDPGGWATKKGCAGDYIKPILLMAISCLSNRLHTHAAHLVRLFRVGLGFSVDHQFQRPQIEIQHLGCTACTVSNPHSNTMASYSFPGARSLNSELNRKVLARQAKFEDPAYLHSWTADWGDEFDFAWETNWCRESERFNSTLHAPRLATLLRFPYARVLGIAVCAFALRFNRLSPPYWGAMQPLCRGIGSLEALIYSASAVRSVGL
ncbi:hypothetical protein B0H11DRAFT_1927212 [Mycena galericulata]|nr:hypothetical protein B0H11DRAFT_1927212 [Mycena galericulata]